MSEYMKNSEILCNFFIQRGYSEKLLRVTIKEVSKIKREDLLRDCSKKKRDAGSIFVSDWHPKLSKIPFLLKKNFHLIENNSELTKIFPANFTVAYRRSKSIRNHVVRNDLQNECRTPSTTKCGKCKLCSNLSTNNFITNEKKNISIQLNDFGNCRSESVIYAAWCNKHDSIYVGHTGEPLQTRFSKHRYDIAKRPKNSELAEHFHKNHQANDMDIYILQTGLPDEKQREFLKIGGFVVYKHSKI